MGPSAPDLAALEAAADGSEALLQDGGQRLCFSTLGAVQCCKVGMGMGMGYVSGSHKPSAWSILATTGTMIK